MPQQEFSIVGDAYKKMEGYNQDADLGAGCGLPTNYAKINVGDTVVDLGCGAGNDCFIARTQTRETGKIIGIDFTPEMINRAKTNAEKLGFSNMEFILGDIENIPLASDTADVVVSNCVLNLIPDKIKAFSEIKRIIKPGAHFSISDLVYVGTIPNEIKNSRISYVKCVAGAIPKDEYLKIIKDLGFVNISLYKEEKISMPDNQLADFLTEQEIRILRESSVEVYSIGVYAEKAIQ
jgi:SAM-dependent methyltransferase